MDLEFSVDRPDINQVLDLAWMLGEPAMIWGEPGLGKTQGLEARAKKEGYRLIPVLAGAMEPTDLGGIPFPYKNLYTKYLAPYWAFQCSDHPAVPEEYRGPTVVFFDDITLADEQTQGTFHKFVHEGIVGECRIRNNVRVFAAGNRTDDKSAAQEMIKSLGNRFIHFNAFPDHNVFINWGREHGNIDELIIGYLRFAPDKISTFQANLNSSEPAFATPRTWDQFSRGLTRLRKQGFNFDDDEILDENSKYNLVFQVAKASLGEGVAHDFNAYMFNSRGMTKPEHINKDPHGAVIPTELDKLWATLTGAESFLRKNPDSWKNFAIYAVRMSKPEYGLLLTKNIIKAVNQLPKSERLIALASDELSAITDKWENFFSA